MINTLTTRPPTAQEWARWWPAPAKLNLFLHILGQRDDGLHELETVFQILDLSDMLKFEVRDDGQILRTEGDPDIAPEGDLVVKAAKALQAFVHAQAVNSENCSASKGISIRCRKRIPVEAGMGGGSSDAATTLLVLNHLWQCGLSQEQLEKLALGLGADVPLFVAGNSAYARGIGEKLEPLSLGEYTYVIVKPRVSVSTQKIFSHSGLTRDTDPITIHRFLRQYKDTRGALAGRNDCQKVVVNSFPEIAQVIDWLDNFGEARLTGTGSAVFLRCSDKSTAKAIMDQLNLSTAAQKWQLMLAQGLDRSPLATIFDQS